MQYREYTPTILLRKFVNTIWTIDSSGSSTASIHERVIPDGCIELIFHLGNPLVRTTPDGIVSTQPQTFVAGQFSRFVSLDGYGNVKLMGIRFFP